MKKKHRSIAAASLVGLFAPLSTLPAMADTQDHIVADQNTSADLEFEDEIKRDLTAYIEFMLNTAYPLYEAEFRDYPLRTIEEMEQDELARGPTKFFEYSPGYVSILRYRVLRRLLDGCYGEPQLADYAWAANAMATYDYSANQLHWARNFANTRQTSIDLSAEERQAFYDEFRTLHHNSSRWIDGLNADYLRQNPDIAQRLHNLDRHAQSNFTEAMDPSGFGLSIKYATDLSVVFGSNSRFMVDPDYSTLITAMMNIPAEEYWERKLEAWDAGMSIEPSVLYHFDHSRPCLPE